MADTKELQVKEKQEVAAPAEQTSTGLVFRPDVDIFETQSDIVLLADMPGVPAESVTVDLRDGVLTLAGEVKPWESGAESDILVEFEIGRYHRRFTLSDAVDQEKIDAAINDGVLRLTLPKARKAKPRQIAVKAG